MISAGDRHMAWARHGRPQFRLKLNAIVAGHRLGCSDRAARVQGSRSGVARVPGVDCCFPLSSSVAGWVPIGQLPLHRLSPELPYAAVKESLLWL